MLDCKREPYGTNFGIGPGDLISEDMFSMTPFFSGIIQDGYGTDRLFILSALICVVCRQH